MQISQNFSQRMEQKLVMTRQMIQSIEMLQLPLMDLMQNINQELVSNPWLELHEGDVVQETPEAGPKEQAEIDRKQVEAGNETDARVKRLESLMKIIPYLSKAEARPGNGSVFQVEGVGLERAGSRSWIRLIR